MPSWDHMPLPSVIRLHPSDAERYTKLRRRMLRDAPWAFSASPDEDIALDLTHLRRTYAEPHSATFAIEAPPPDASDLVASAGIYRMTQPKFLHRAQIWGVFVAEPYRGRGFGRAVMTAAVDVARTWPGVVFVDLAVSANLPEAQSLYVSMGIESLGRGTGTCTDFVHALDV